MSSRSEYQKAYYQANKARLKAARMVRGKPVRTDAIREAEARYRAKKKLLSEIENFPFGVSPFAEIEAAK